jgi:hypothetical protein
MIFAGIPIIEAEAGEIKAGSIYLFRSPFGYLLEPGLKARRLHIMNVLFRQARVLKSPGNFQVGHNPATLRQFTTTIIDLKPHITISKFQTVILFDHATLVLYLVVSSSQQPDYFPPNASSEMSTAALFVAKMAFILPRVTGKTLLVKNSRLLSCPS